MNEPIASNCRFLIDNIHSRKLHPTAVILVDIENDVAHITRSTEEVIYMSMTGIGTKKGGGE